MNIAIDGRAAKWYRGTGIGTYTYQIINNLNQIDFLNKYQVFLPEDVRFDYKFRNNFSQMKSAEECNSNFWEEVKIPNILHDEDIDIYHVPQNGVGLSNYIQCKKIITLHDIIPLRMPETCSDRYLKIFNNIMPEIIKNCDGIITVSNFSKEDIAKEFNYPKNKIFVTYLASEDCYRPLEKEHCKSAIKDRYSIDSDFILYVGGFSPRKNILSLINAFSLLKSKYKKDIKLVIAGKKGISYSIYKKRVSDLNLDSSVIFPGFIRMEDMPSLYNCAKLFVYPSFYEGFGLPPLEAMACGTPVIASNTSSIPEILKDSAVLLNPNDTDKLYESMCTVLEDCSLRERLIEKGLQHSLKYNWKKTAYDTIEAYKNTLAR